MKHALDLHSRTFRRAMYLALGGTLVAFLADCPALEDAGLFIAAACASVWCLIGRP